MKAVFVLSLVAAVLVAQSNAQALICAGAAGQSSACAPACSNMCVNDDVSGDPNQGCFNTGGGNEGDANDGFNNQGSFNIGSSNLGDCSLQSGTTGGTCADANFDLVVRYCHVYPSKAVCQNPPAYFPAALVTQVQAVVASCNGVTVPSPPPGSASPPPPSPPLLGSPPPAPTTPSPAGTPPAPAPVSPPIAPAPSAPFGVSDSTADLATLLGLFAEHIALEKAQG